MSRTSVHLAVDPTNPGQFFACCGLLELADRLWSGAEGWFVADQFAFGPLASSTREEVLLADLISAIAKADLEQMDEADETASPLRLNSAFGLRLDWWREPSASAMKLWAGRMNSTRIARAMQNALVGALADPERLLDHAAVVYEPSEPDKKVEPFYFDARRGASATALDIGFMPDALSMTALAFPAVEFLCLVGLQRFRPTQVKVRVFDYATWTQPLDTRVAPLAAASLLDLPGARTYRFEVQFRTDQRKHKAFTSATPL